MGIQTSLNNFRIVSITSEGNTEYCEAIICIDR
jgi:hypothetical protein